MLESAAWLASTISAKGVAPWRDVEDTATLHSPTDLHLVVLAFADVSQSEVDDLSRHAAEGILAEVVSIETGA